MSHLGIREAVNRTVIDLKENDIHMGRVTVTLAGDLGKTLPVIPKCYKRR